LSSSLYLNADAMTGLGIGTEPGTAGSVIAHSNGPFTSSARMEVPTYRSGTKGSGDLSDLKASMAIKSSPTLGSMPLILSPSAVASHTATSVSTPRSQTPNPTTSSTSHAGPLSRLGMTKAFQRSTSPSGVARSSSLLRRPSTSSPSSRPETPSALPWLRLKTSSSTPGPSLAGSSPVDSPSSVSSPRLSDAAAAPTTSKSNQSTLKRANSSSVKITASAILSGLTGAAAASPGAVVHGSTGGAGGLNLSTPPPILLDYELGTSSSLDLPSQFYYNPGEPVEGDVDVDPSTSTESKTGRRSRGRGRGRRATEGDEEGHDGEEGDDDEEDGEHLVDEDYGSSSFGYGVLPPSTTVTNDYGLIDPDEFTMPSHRDPVLKIAVLKGVYDQILYNYENAHHRRLTSQDAYWTSEDGTIGGGASGSGGPGGLGTGPGGMGGAGGRDGFGSLRGHKKGSDRFKLFRFLSPLGANHLPHPQHHQPSTTMSSISHRASKDYSSGLLSEQPQQHRPHSLFQYPAQHLSNVVHTT
ncbi:hypothetical protein BGZ73_009251, partial [Actinomortierella ambigua]